MKIAILHDYFDEIGGAELTLLQLARGLKADIYTTNIDEGTIEKAGFSDIDIKSIGKVIRLRHIKQLLTQIKFARLQLKEYDFVILGGPSSIYAAKNNKPNFWCCFSPPRGLYDLRYRYHGKYNVLVQLIKKFQILFDKNAVKNIERIVAPSLNVQTRIKKYYCRESVLLYHPIEAMSFYYKEHKNYWFSLARIDPYKRLELQLEAFKKMPGEKLLLVGDAEDKTYLKKLKDLSPPNVLFKGPVYDPAEKKELYAHCKGFIVTAEDEDFGLTCLEAMASGKPVIAVNEGGYKETVTEKTGVLIDNVTSGKIARAIQRINQELKDNPEKYKEPCQVRARNFDISIFIQKFRELLK